MASPKTVADSAQVLGKEPTAPEAIKTADASAPAIPEKKATRFVRNIQPDADVMLPDGTIISFHRYLFFTADEELIKKIQAVAKEFHIVT